VLNLVKKTTFWEFRVDYLAELGAALHNARYVEVLSVDQVVIADAIAFMAVCMRTQRLSIAGVCQTFVCRDNTLVLMLAGMHAQNAGARHRLE